MTLDVIVAQDRAMSILRSAVEGERLPHALSFVGPEGVGKRTASFALLGSIVCEAEGTALACGICSGCRDLSAGSHPDVHEIAPAIEGNERRRLSIDQIRDLQRALSRRPHRAPRRAAIVDGAETLTEPAQNALLKTLEEPPGNALLVLLSTSASALLPTVRSRCQQVPFRAIPESELEELLVGRFEKSADEAARLARHASGSVGRALSLNPRTLEEAEDRVTEALRSARTGYPDIAMEARDLAEEEKRTGGLVLPMIVAELRRRLRDAAASPLTGAEKGETLRDALRAAGVVVETSRDLARNANRGLALEAMLAQIGPHL